MLDPYICFYNDINKIYHKDAFNAIISYDGDDKKIFLQQIYIAIGIPGDSENFDALSDDYKSFYWIKDKTKIFLIHKSLPNNEYLVDMYLNILFSAIYCHIDEPESYIMYVEGQGYIPKHEELYAFFPIEWKEFIKEKYTYFLNGNYYLRRQGQFKK